MSHLKFLNVCLIDNVPDNGRIDAHCCLRALERFRANVQLALVPTMIPGFASWMAMEWITASNKAHSDLFRKRDPATLDERQRNALGKLMEGYMFSSLARTSLEDQKNHLVEKTTMFEKFSIDAGPIGILGLENILQSVVIQSWTAIEVLVEDLLADAVVDHSSLFEHFNIDDHGFRTRDKFREAYRKAFPTEYANIRSCTKSAFFDALALLRNIIVHKGSKADDQFLGSAKDIAVLSQYHRLNAGDDVKLNGETVRIVVNGSLAAAYALIEAVNDWIRPYALP